MKLKNGFSCLKMEYGVNNKAEHTTFCIVHSGLCADFEHCHSPVVRWFAER